MFGVLSLAPCYVGKKAGTWSWSDSISQSTAWSFIGDSHAATLSPPTLLKKGEDRRKKKREILHLFRCYTHTHPAGAGSTLKGKRKKKADTNDGPNDQNSAGSGTNLHGETDLTKTEHTPKPHDTLRRGTKGELGTKWGTSWWQTRETKTIN